MKASGRFLIEVSCSLTLPSGSDNAVFPLYADERHGTAPPFIVLRKRKILHYSLSK